MFRHRRWAVVAILVLLTIPLLWSHWQPARQARLYTEQLMAAVESRDWRRVGGLVADDYTDSWGHDKAVVLERLREVFAQFFVLELRAGEIEVETSDRQAITRTPVTLRGRGGPFAEMAIQRVGALREPFIFTWRQESSMPWDWAL